MIGFVLVAAFLVAAFVARSNLSEDIITWALLSAINAAALALVLAALVRSHMPPVFYGAILIELLIGSLFQLFFFSYNLLRNRLFIIEQAPFHGFVTPDHIARAYGLITLVFATTCILLAILASIPTRTTLPKFASAVGRNFPTMLIVGTVGYVLFTTIQISFGIGRSALYNPTLPFRLVAITLFYQRYFFPALLLLGIWVYERRNRRLSYWCLAGTGMVAAVASYTATSRGAIMTLGGPVVFLWLLTGRFTKFRKFLVVAAFGVYLVSAPVLTSLRVARVHTITGGSPSGLLKPDPLSAASLNYELGHFVFRVGGAGSLLFAIDHQDKLSLEGIKNVIRPSGLTSHFTRDVVGLPRSATVASNQAPTAIGLGTMIGGATGAVLYVSAVVVALDMSRRVIMRTFRSWPVALAILAFAAVIFFSEGVTINLYKSFLTVGLIEVLFRYAGPPSKTAAASPGRPPVASARHNMGWLADPSLPSRRE